METTIALCLLTLNEIDGCRHDIPLLSVDKFDQIYCLDGGSTDGTVEYISSLGIDVYKQKVPGLNNACIEAVEHCKCNALIFFHPKGTIPVESCYLFRPIFDRGYDLVIGSRMMKDSVNEEDIHFLRPRKWFVLFLALSAKLLFQKEGNTVWDVLHGFRGIRVEAFRKMQISQMNPSVDIEMVCRAYKMGFSRYEFPVCESQRIGGGYTFQGI